MRGGLAVSVRIGTAEGWKETLDRAGVEIRGDRISEIDKP
jgi:hypothetical protein